MPTIEEMLQSTELTDDIKLTLGGQEVTVGDLRKYVAARKQTADAALADAVSRRKKADEDIANATKLSEDALALYNKSEESLRKVAPPKDGDIDWDADPVYSPVGKRFKTLEERLTNEVLNEVAQMKKALGAGFNFVTNEYQKQRWNNTIPEADRPKDKTYKDYVKLAAEQKIMDEYGLADPVEAWNRETAAAREAVKLKEAEDRGIEKGRKLAAAASLPRPGSGPRVPLPSQKPEFKDMNAAFAAAANDPEIMRIANGGDN